MSNSDNDAAAQAAARAAEVRNTAQRRIQEAVERLAEVDVSKFNEKIKLTPKNVDRVGYLDVLQHTSGAIAEPLGGIIFIEESKCLEIVTAKGVFVISMNKIGEWSLLKRKP